MTFAMTKKGITALVLSILAGICTTLNSFDFISAGIGENTAGIVTVVAMAVNSILIFLMGKNEKLLSMSAK